MITARTIRKASFFVAVASFVFTLIAAFVKYLQLDLTTLGAPASYYTYTVLIEVFPYLFVGVVALLISVLVHDEEPAYVECPSPPQTDTA
jgi:hypothetical protein